jgi:hypothetical protein
MKMIYNKNMHSNPDPYPTRESFSVIRFYKNGEVFGPFKAVGYSAAGGLLINEYNKKHKEFLKEVWFDAEKFKQALQEWNIKENTMKDKWKEELFKEEGVYINNTATSTQINNKIYARAWDEAHSEGYEAVEGAFTDLVSFVESIVEPIFP